MCVVWLSKCYNIKLKDKFIRLAVMLVDSPYSKYIPCR